MKATMLAVFYTLNICMLSTNAVFTFLITIYYSHMLSTIINSTTYLLLTQIILTI